LLFPTGKQPFLVYSPLSPDTSNNDAPTSLVKSFIFARILLAIPFPRYSGSVHTEPIENTSTYAGPIFKRKGTKPKKHTNFSLSKAPNARLELLENTSGNAFPIDTCNSFRNVLSESWIASSNSATV